jgi:hypothetical protein
VALEGNIECDVGLCHRRSEEAVARRRARSVILACSFRDIRKSETVCMVNRVDVAGLLPGPVDYYLVPDVIKGEILVDSRGSGSFQRA